MPFPDGHTTANPNQQDLSVTPLSPVDGKRESARDEDHAEGAFEPLADSSRRHAAPARPASSTSPAVQAVSMSTWIARQRHQRQDEGPVRGRNCGRNEVANAATFGSRTRPPPDWPRWTVSASLSLRRASGGNAGRGNCRTAAAHVPPANDGGNGWPTDRSSSPT